MECKDPVQDWLTYNSSQVISNVQTTFNGCTGGLLGQKEHCNRGDNILFHGKANENYWWETGYLYTTEYYQHLRE
jgi:hypothetical protein